MRLGRGVSLPDSIDVGEEHAAVIGVYGIANEGFQ
jgi:hypothetical protein